MAVISFENKVYAYESINTTNSAVGLSSNYITTGREDYFHIGAVITVEGHSVRIRLDGTDPTTSEGHLVDVGDVIVLYGEDVLSSFKAISSDGTTTATLKVSYFKWLE